MHPLGDPLTTHPINMGWEFTIEWYPGWRFGFIDNPDRPFGSGPVWTRTRTRSDGPEPLLTLSQGHLASNNRLPVSIFQLLPWLLSYCPFCLHLLPPRLFTNPHNCVVSCARSFCWRARPPSAVLTCWQSRYGVDSTLKVDCRCPLFGCCRRCWLDSPVRVARSRV